MTLPAAHSRPSCKSPGRSTEARENFCLQITSRLEKNTKRGRGERTQVTPTQHRNIAFKSERGRKAKRGEQKISICDSTKFIFSALKEKNKLKENGGGRRFT
uniref:Uncharacterized protein n=1 Tax=Castor canadensis TaxID=51338 RepID=A0A8C0ZLV1_CASCN